MAGLGVELSGISTHLGLIIVIVGLLWLMSAGNLHKSIQILSKKQATSKEAAKPSTASLKTEEAATATSK